VLIWSATTFDLEAVVPAAIEGKSVCFDVPTEVFGPDHDGTLDTTMVLGDFFQPTDWAPDALRQETQWQIADVRGSPATL
jgi:hypothetical protein